MSIRRLNWRGEIITVRDVEVADGYHKLAVTQPIGCEPNYFKQGEILYVTDDVLPTIQVGRAYRTMEQCLERYPRLVRAMQRAAILSRYEAAAGIRDYRAARDGYLPADLKRYGGGEAVAHFGGPLAVIDAAIKGRRMERHLRLLLWNRRVQA